MALPEWPASLPAKPMREGLRGVAHAPGRRTPMESGQARARALGPRSPAALDLGWRMTAEQFSRFKAFYTGPLDRGTQWFTCPVWTGGEVAARVVRFDGAFRAVPRAAAAVTVTARLTLRALPYDDPGTELLESFLDADGAPVWPDVLPLPLQEGTALDPHRPLPATDFETGPKAAINPFPPSPAEQPVRWSMSVEQFEIFKAFYFEALAQGTVWCPLPLWFGIGLETVDARFIGPWSFEPHKADRILVSAQLEQRKLAVADEGTLALIDMMGFAGLSAFGPGIHGWVHETWPGVFEE
ncbi:hypothetical protein [Parvibaculum sp.]|uniref:hypothetical protein n=1 Tax=Parvibaculum sp. TaxID=2024848 RepID=UPI001E069288|nr:hypothetical protein [Parvibaculum sp.]MBX3488862.1 hypothetical protein [Parvibaculum sp.]